MLLTSLLLIVSLASSTRQNLYGVQDRSRMIEISTTPTMSEQEVSDQRSEVLQSESAQRLEDVSTPHDSDDEPMVYEIPQDYATWARQERNHRIAEGADPDSVILQSEVCSHVPRQKGDSAADFAERYVETMNAMAGRGVSILNDISTADVLASGFSTADGRFFDLGPGSGATKGEFREFSHWFSEIWETGQTLEVPEKWLKFEKPGIGRSDL